MIDIRRWSKCPPLAVCGLSLALASCGGGGHTLPSGQPSSQKAVNTAKAVAVVADTERQLNASIRQATAAGKTPRFVVVESAGKKHRFTVFAQMVRTDKFLIVRGYQKMFVFPANHARVLYDGADVTSTLPVGQMKPRLADAIVNKSSIAKGEFSAGTLTARNRLGTTWASLKDPWQTAPDYVVADGNDATQSTGRHPAQWHRPYCSPFEGGYSPPGCICAPGTPNCYPYYYYYYYPVPYYPPYQPPEYDYSDESAFTIHTPYDSTNTDVAFDDPGAGGGEGITVTSRRRQPQSAKPGVRRTQQVVGACHGTTDISSGSFLLTIAFSSFCTRNIVLTQFVATPIFYDFNFQSTVSNYGAAKSVSFGRSGSLYTARLKFTSSDLGGSRIVKFAMRTDGYGPGNFVGVPFEHTVPINQRLAVYPQVTGFQGNGYEKIPFPPDAAQTEVPAYFFRNCYGQAGTNGCQAHISGYRNSVIAYYNANGWPIPGSPFDCHHIHPLAWGGGNDVQNGVLLSPGDHGKFTSWWSNIFLGGGGGDPGSVDPDCS